MRAVEDSTLKKNGDQVIVPGATYNTDVFLSLAPI